MKTRCILLLVFSLSLFGVSADAQKSKNKKKDEGFSVKLVCPFENGTGREPKEAFTWDPPDKKVIMISKTDTAVRSCIDAKVLSVNPTEDGRFEVVIYYNEYYFWYYGLTKALVNVNQSVKAAQLIGTYTFGHEMEFRMFKDEDPVDPREFLECKSQVE
jgi:murein DD-endopeptidase MepM/ murein hydrolase activator NlpD